MIIDSHCHLLSMEYENVDEQIIGPRVYDDIAFKK